MWFEVCWAFVLGKDGISALSLQRTLEIGSYVTAAMLHRLRRVLVRPGRDRLSGTVEVDETYIGGIEQFDAGLGHGLEEVDDIELGHEGVGELDEDLEESLLGDHAGPAFPWACARHFGPWVAEGGSRGRAF